MEEYLFENTLQDSDGKDPTNLYFLIRPKEGMSIPHFHIVNILEVSDKEKYSKKYFECCIQLKCYAYWNHKPWMRKIPNQKLKDKIVQFLMSSNADTKGLPVWKFLKERWLERYPNNKELRYMKDMPDYSKLATGPGR